MALKNLPALACHLVLSGLLVLAWPAHAEDPADAPCAETAEARIWISPLNPKADTPVKLMGVATDGAVSELALADSQGRRIPLQAKPRGGPPWSLAAELAGLGEGRYRVEARREGRVTSCRLFTVGGANAREALTWNLATEAFYAAWVEALFDAPPEESLSFPSLEPVLRDPGRNFLHNHLGLNEDRALPSTPDCADLPYTLRAYFAWKTGLPVAFRPCSRGSASAPPRCGAASLKTDFTRGAASQASFRNVSGQLANAVHSGSARTGLDDDTTDLYPVALNRESLWPGTVYADPYGHVLVVAQWLPQAAGRPGILLAVDAQPDNSVTRKRFWEGTFLFANVASAGPGFKAFRPIVPTASGGLRILSNDELVDNPGFAPFSLEQDSLSPDDFYARLAKLINPRGLDPRQAYEATLDALAEQLETRVTSVENGEAYFRKNPGAVVAMPSGPAIFETIGPWEDYSTPSRDMRLIIAINVLNGLPDKIVRHPELFAMNGASPGQAKADIEQYHTRRIQERKIRYTRSDGSPWELTVAEILARKPLYEMTYNPNDCAEMRWGAKPGSEEYAPCHRHAPEAQHAKMEQYRAWFREARRPTR
jgi:hypothetical protein